MKKIILSIFLLVITTSLLAENQDYGSISILSRPSRYVKIDKQEIDKTPLMKSKLKVGEHFITLYCKGEAISETFKVIIEKNKDKKIIKKYSNKCGKSKKYKKAHHTKHREFNKNEKSANHGYISLISKPSTSIKIDGKMMGRTPLIKHKILKGQHTIQLYDKDKNISDKFKIFVRANRVSPVIKKYLKSGKVNNTKLTKKYRRNRTGGEVKYKKDKFTDYGYLSIISKPNTEIDIDGETSGLKTPLVKFEMTSGTYTIRLHNKDRNIDDTFKVKIRKGKVKAIIKKYNKDGNKVLRKKRK